MPQDSGESQSQRLVDEYYAAIRLSIRSADTAVYAARPVVQAAAAAARHDSSLLQAAQDIHLAAYDLTGTTFNAWLADSASTNGCAGGTSVQQSIKFSIAQLAANLLAHRSKVELYRNRQHNSVSPSGLALKQMADHALLKGLRTGVGVQEALLTEALGLLERYLDHDGAETDAVAWLDAGWLHWQVNGSIDEAWQCFSNCVEVSADDAAGMQLLGMKHLAHILYLKEDYSSALALAEESACLSVCHDALFDCARYASLAGDAPKSIVLLEKCIEIVPFTCVTMFGEPDFIPILGSLGALAHNLLSGAQEIATTKLKSWQDAVSLVESQAEKAECVITMPPVLRQNVALMLHEMSDTNFLVALETATRAVSCRSMVFRHARERLQTEITARVSALNRTLDEVAQANRQAAAEKTNAQKDLNTALTIALSEGSKKPRMEMGLSFGIALIATIAAISGLNSIERGLAIFLPVLAASVGLSYILSVIIGILSYVAKTDAARDKHKRHIQAIETGLRRAVVPLQQSATRLREMKTKAEKSLGEIKLAEIEAAKPTPEAEIETKLAA
ncbi:MAG: hypothetical protein WCL39_04565 [Armatimonadota bacterium]